MKNRIFQRKLKLRPIIFGSGCHVAPLLSLFQKSDIVQYEGGGVIQYGPSEANLLIIPSFLNPKLLRELKRVYDQMPAPKWVMALGYHIDPQGRTPYGAVIGWESFLPVDIYIPGMPPSAEEVLKGLELLRDRIRGGVIASRTLEESITDEA